MVSRIRSLESETKKVHEIDGYLVQTDSTVRLLTGPVVGEVSTLLFGIYVTDDRTSCVLGSYAARSHSHSFP